MLRRTSARASARGATLAEPRDLLAAFADEPESKAGEFLTSHGLDPSRLLQALGVDLDIAPELATAANEEDARHDLESELLPFSMDLRTILNDAKEVARQWDRSVPLSSEHLLSGFLSSPSPYLDLLAEQGVDPQALRELVNRTIHDELGPLPVDEGAPLLELTEPGEDIELARIFDASANRAREGLRVVEDYVRFALDDPMLTKRLKNVRHRLTKALKSLDDNELLGSRDTPNDVGTHIMTVEEQSRETPQAVIAANFKRVGEAVRSMEEYAKLKNVWLAGQFEVLRYDVYTIEKMVHTALNSRKALGDARLYVLVGGLPTLGDLTWTVGEALEGGADVIQLREKNISDRELLSRAQDLRILTAQAKAKLIINDRPDIARLCNADGVHLGQTDLKPRDARKIVGARAQIGLSTHNPEQIRQAVLDSAGYFAVGPVFSSDTKRFEIEELAGLSLVRHATENSTLPWFAIGGINESNIDQVLEAGAQRVAVSATVIRASSPRKAARALRDKLEASIR